MELIFLLPIFLPFLTAIFLFLNKKLFNELITNFFTLNSALLSFAIAAYSFIALGLDKFKPVNVELFQWISNPDISIVVLLLSCLPLLCPFFLSFLLSLFLSSLSLSLSLLMVLHVVSFSSLGRVVFGLGRASVDSVIQSDFTRLISTTLYAPG